MMRTADALLDTATNWMASNPWRLTFIICACIVAGLRI